MKRNKNTAKEAELGDLHAELARKLKDAIVNGEAEIRNGEEVRVPVKAATLNVARQFLKDNSIVCDSGLPTAELGELTDALDDFNRSVLEEDSLPVFKN